MRRVQQIPVLLLAVMAVWLPGKVEAQTNAWAGSRSCRDCHEKFYQLWWGEHRDPAQALREAQSWLRNVTLSQIRHRLIPEKRAMQRQGLPPVQWQPIETFLARYGDSSPTLRLFEHPYYWAGFAFYGA